MYQVNDLVIYSTHGICKIVDITEKDYTNELKTYYELRPLRDLKLQIHIPVDSPTLKMVELLNEQEAYEIIESFKNVDIINFEKNYFVSQGYNKMIADSDRSKVASTIYSLLIRKNDLMESGKKLHLQESKALINLQGILYNELAIVLQKTYDEIADMIEANTAFNI